MNQDLLDNIQSPLKVPLKYSFPEREKQGKQFGMVIAYIPAKTKQEHTKRFILKLPKVSCFKI